MTSRQWYRRKRSIKIERSVEIIALLAQLEGQHPPGPSEYGRVWRLATGLSLVAALYLPVVVGDLSGLTHSNSALFLLLGATVFIAVTLSFLLLSTHTHTYTLTVDTITCHDRRGELRWSLSFMEIKGILIRHLPEERLFLYLLTEENPRRFPVHAHRSICEKLGPLAHSHPPPSAL